jgi:dihydropteroate synthase
VDPGAAFSWGALLAGARAPVMGIVNVTPDSFSDGGRYLDPGAAAAHGLRLAADGAAVLDVGGESTRPGASPVDAEEERRRVVPVVRRLRAETDVPVSVDTTKADVAAAAIEAGAAIVNDVSAGTFDPCMLRVVAEAGTGYVAMHMLGEPKTMQDDPRYEDVVREVSDHLRVRVDDAVDAGVDVGRVMADPGIGFGKTLDHNLALLARLPLIAERVGAPLLVGTSRKGFIGQVLEEPDPSARGAGTLATVVWALSHGASMVRVHDVAAAVRAAEVVRVVEDAAA